MIITLGRHWDSGMRLGKLNIAKGRKCIADAKKVANWIGTNEGLFYIASDALYAKYRGNGSTRRLFSYDELVAQDILDESISSAMNSSLNI